MDQRSTPFFLTLGGEESRAFAITFAGQASPWRQELNELIEDQRLKKQLEGLLEEVSRVLAPAQRDLTLIGNGRITLDRLTGDTNTLAFTSMPGIVLTQLATMIDLANQGFDLRKQKPVAVLGHSQGVLTEDVFDAWSKGHHARLVDLLAISQLMGAAATAQTRKQRAVPIDGATPMLSVRNITTEQAQTLVDLANAKVQATGADAAAISLINGPSRTIFSGRPEDLARVKVTGEELAAKDRREIESKVKGGKPYTPRFDFLDVSAPFHHALLAPAVVQVENWAAACDLPVGDAVRLAELVFVTPVDWPAALSTAIDAGAQWIMDLGSGNTIGRINAEYLEGSCTGVIDAGTVASRDALLTPGFKPKEPQDWSEFIPGLLELPDGTTVLDTAFSRLTGMSPILLAGMTPTTVDPDIVAAAANAGYWAELAGGGQVTEEVFQKNLAGLKDQLNPGRTVQFNAMFLDPYLWNLQFGTQNVVPKARAAGAPIDGVVVSAGIPEEDEAVALVHRLNAAGFPYVAFKPGTVAQIRQVLQIAKSLDGTPVIMQVEDGHAGGHHSWENLDDLLLETYAQVREAGNVVLVVGGGIGTPERAQQYLSGEWVKRWGRPAMPVDGVLIGTAAMTALEAKTAPEVKQMLVDTPGIPVEDDGKAGWVAAGGSRGGMSSGLSHLRADIYEIDNTAAACGRLIAEVAGDEEKVIARREEIIKALDQTAKPYFGDVDQMTYLQWAKRFADLSHPWNDPTWTSRFLHLLQRIEGRLSPLQVGEITSLFADEDAVSDPAPALDKLAATYPQSETTQVTPTDAAWFVELCRSYPKPMPFVPVLDSDLLRWWGQDNLWQSHDARYSADQVRIIPGPVSVAGITKMNEPIADLLGRFETACVQASQEAGTPVQPVFSRLGAAATPAEFAMRAPHVTWSGNLVDNPARVLNPAVVTIIDEDPAHIDLQIRLDTYWDEDEAASENAASMPHAVRRLDLPLDLPPSTYNGGSPLIDYDKLPASMFALLAGTAGSGGHNVAGDPITGLPEMEPSDRSPFGVATWQFTLEPQLADQHRAVTGEALPNNYRLGQWTPDALLGMCWPAIYAALGSATINGYPVIEGLLSAVHLDHTAELDVDLNELVKDGNQTITVKAWTDEVEESSAGRLVVVREELFHGGVKIGAFMERFAIRGRITSDAVPKDVPFASGRAPEVLDAPRTTLRKASVTAPSDMTAFANVSGDFNPIHTSLNAALVAGLDAALVHGMWLSAVAQNMIEADYNGKPGHRIVGWTYNMYGLVNLDAVVDLTVERLGALPGGGLLLEVTARIDGTVVSRGTAATAAPRTAYVYPGQGIQSQGMALDEIPSSPAAADVWRRADKVTKSRLGFSITEVVRDNPQALTVSGTTWRHPEGVLNLTQFTQVALATVAFAQTARLREKGVLVEDAYFAGHSLGEYNALSAYGEIFPLETVLEIVYHRGSTMHNLIERDEQGRSNYRMGALRPNQFGVGDADIVDYVKSVADASGEFLQIVNYNLADQQYAIAGTIAGLAALEEDANRRAKEAKGRGAFMYVPGVDVPFHSEVLRGGVEEFRQKVDTLLPKVINTDRLLGRYVPNLVARPFALDRDFVESIVEVVPAAELQKLLDSPSAWKKATADENGFARLLLIELLAWQFASPVRWIETQDLAFTPVERGGLGIERFVEIGLGAAPTLAGLGEKTLKAAKFAHTFASVLNVQRDEKVVLNQDDVIWQEEDASDEPAASAAPAADAAVAANTAAAASAPVSSPAPASAPAATSATAAAPAPSGGPRPEDLPYKASDAVATLMANTNKIRPDQIGSDDTTDTLTAGVSARRNQLLMDLSAELGLPSIDGAADATVVELSESVNKLAHHYKPFGPVLSEALRDRLRKVLGAAGLKQSFITDRVEGVWQLGAGWAAHVTSQVLLGSREGDSARGGALATLSTQVTSKEEAEAMVDAAVQEIAAAHGVSVGLPSSGAAEGGGVVDSAALVQLREEALGETGALAATARHMLKVLGLDAANNSTSIELDETAALNQRAFEALSEELGASWLDMVEPRFNPAKAVLLDDRWASAREDLARLALANDEEGVKKAAAGTGFWNAGQAVANQAKWWADKAREQKNKPLAKALSALSYQANGVETGNDTKTRATQYANDVALVTGVTPASITGEVVAGLLRGGATVIATSSRVDTSRLQFAKELYRENAAPGAKLWLVPANLASYRDLDALIKWIGTEQSHAVGPKKIVDKEALVPTLFFPFAAPSVSGTLADSGAKSESQARLLLWSVEHSIAALSALVQDVGSGAPMHVILPGSPNRGMFGGDGAYGETKAAFDALTARWKVESDWARGVTFAHPKIGWVRGTGLMGGNDPLVAAAEAGGVKTYSTAEMAEELLALTTSEAREKAATAPLEADLSGGLDDGVDLRALRDEAIAAAANQADAANDEDEASTSSAAVIPALPNPPAPKLADFDPKAWKGVSTSLSDMIVAVGVGEIGPWGSARTRHDAELGILPDGSADLSPAAVLEMAWMMGLITWQDSPSAGWYDAEGNIVAEADIHARYKDEIVANAGVRAFINDWAIESPTTEESTATYLSEDFTFSVPDEATARSYLIADEAGTRIAPRPDGEWDVTRAAGSMVRLPRRADLSRQVGGQFPTGYSPARWGLSPALMESMDRIASWNLVSAVDAFTSSGFSPEELLQNVHPAEVASTQGTGFGGMTSMRKLFVDRYQGEEYPQDVLQETLPNVVAAHTMQSYVGGYGAMIQPVAACATAAVSVEEGVDKIATGKASFVVAGAIDDIAIESVVGFGSMNATADTAEMRGKGISDRFFSRANDRRRGGFVESQGGGTVLLTRGDIAAEMGLPVLAVVAYVQSFADGIHTSIPAPGLGALASGRGGSRSRLARALASLGVSPDEIKMVSKHDTSTNANDPNESELHTRLAEALGRTPGNPLFVVSQKSVTGHSKGGAALFQLAGVSQAFVDGTLPANRSLDCVDDAMAKYPHLVWLREPLAVGAANTAAADKQPSNSKVPGSNTPGIKAALITSLGFGHVSSVVAAVHPGAFEEALRSERGEDARVEWREKASERLREGARKLEAGMLGRVPLYAQTANRRLPEGETLSRETEAAMLLNEDARLGANGVYA